MSEQTTRDRFFDLIGKNPCIAGIKDEVGLTRVLASDCEIVFVLYGNVINIHAIVNKLKQHGKMVFVNVDLIDGLATKEIVVDYVRQYIQSDGLLSSKAPIIKAAKSQGLFTFHRFFVIDSFSYHNLIKQAELSRPDIVEIVPGCMPKVIAWALGAIRQPIVAGGLVCDQEEAQAALRAGACAISSTNPEVWKLEGSPVEPSRSARRSGPVPVELRRLSPSERSSFTRQPPPLQGNESKVTKAH
jgi:glycerol uptake operon antiterminator